MKDNKKAQKGSISKLVLGLIKSKGLADKDGKDAAKVIIPVVKKFRPASKFQLSHVYWYLARYRRQQKLHKPVDHIVELQPTKPAPKKAAKKATKKVKA